MKTKLMLLFILIGLKVSAQTDSLENVALQQLIQSENRQPESYQSLIAKWTKTMEKYGDYPNLPLNENGAVHYSFISSYEGLKKADLFNHCQEWLALNLGIYPNQLYANADDGKIIFGSSFPANSNYDCTYTGILTIRDGKILSEFIKLEYQSFIPGHYSGDKWVNDQTIQKPIEQLYPLILKDSSNWKPTLELFQTTNERLGLLINELSAYLLNYKQNNDF